jgi:hypothetical protein
MPSRGARNTTARCIFVLCLRLADVGELAFGVVALGRSIQRQLCQLLSCRIGLLAQIELLPNECFVLGLCIQQRGLLLLDLERGHIALGGERLNAFQQVLRTAHLLFLDADLRVDLGGLRLQ